MPLPKLTDLTSNLPGVFDKMKNFVDSIAGSGKTVSIEESLMNETDPLKTKLLELELSIHQYSDLLNHQLMLLNNLKSKYVELQKFLENKDKTASEQDQSTAAEVQKDQPEN